MMCVDNHCPQRRPHLKLSLLAAAPLLSCMHPEVSATQKHNSKRLLRDLNMLHPRFHKAIRYFSPATPPGSSLDQTPNPDEQAIWHKSPPSWICSALCALLGCLTDP